MSVRFKLDGRDVLTLEGTSVASAVFDHGAGRESVTGEARSALCGMGICFECRLKIDGRPQQRSCQLPVHDGMVVETAQRALESTSDPASYGELKTPAEPIHADVAIIGGGPAGIAAAVAAGEAGRSIVLIDDNPAAGGQIWRRSASAAKGPAAAARPWLERLGALSSLRRLHGSTVIDAQPSSATGEQVRLTVQTAAGVRFIAADSLILATGARELFLPFPGWTLPGVLGAGGLQAMIKSGLEVKGKRVVIAGSGPLLLAVADLAREYGAEVLLIAEQAGMAKLSRFAFSLLRQPAKLTQAMALSRRLRGIKRAYGAWPKAASGGSRLQKVLLSNGQEIGCDLLACGFGLLPEIGLATHLGSATHLEHGTFAIQVDAEQRTNISNIFAAGENTGIGGVEAALVEGSIAGRAAAGLAPDNQLAGDRAQAHRFARALAKAFRLRRELLDLPRSDTIVCRCEDVSWQQLSHYESHAARQAKLETRCGMGPCQGRVCGGALGFLLGFAPDRVRPPFFPSALENLMSVESSPGD